MIPKFERLSNILEDKIIIITDAIEKADPTESQFSDLLKNFDLSVGIKSSLDGIIAANKCEHCQPDDEVELLDKED